MASRPERRFCGPKGGSHGAQGRGSRGAHKPTKVAGQGGWAQTLAHFPHSPHSPPLFPLPPLLGRRPLSPPLPYPQPSTSIDSPPLPCTSPLSPLLAAPSPGSRTSTGASPCKILPRAHLLAVGLGREKKEMRGGCLRGSRSLSTSSSKGNEDLSIAVWLFLDAVLFSF